MLLLLREVCYEPLFLYNLIWYYCYMNKKIKINALVGYEPFYHAGDNGVVLCNDEEILKGSKAKKMAQIKVSQVKNINNYMVEINGVMISETQIKMKFGSKPFYVLFEII